MDLSTPTLGLLVEAAVWPESRTGDEALAAAQGLFARGAGLQAHAGVAIFRPSQLLNSLAAYRNRTLGHGGIREDSYYDAAAPVLLAGLEAAWEAELFLPAAAELVYLESVTEHEAGERFARVLRLHGEDSVVENLQGTSDLPADVEAGGTYLRLAGRWQDLRPWLSYEADERGERVLFFNGMRRRPEYLDYLTGEVLAGPELEQRLPGLDARARALFGAEPEPPRPPPEPSPSYELLDRLGSGGMGEVHLARQLSLDRLVALKRLPERASEDAAALERFRREIKALARADHPNVVSVLDSGELHGRPFYAMEFVDGVTLSSLVGELSLDTNWQEVLLRVQGRRQRLMPTAETGGEAPDDRLPSPSGSASSRSASTERWLARLMRDAALGLHHLHELGVVHRDVKPDNLMLTARSGDVVVMDLGLAALEDASRSLSREQSQVVGTLRYLAPEQLRLRRERVDRRADVYSLGATFHELLSGHPLHDGDTEARLIEQIVSGPPRRLSRELPRLDRDLSTIVDTATSREPERRYPTAAALAADLDAWLEGRAISARAPTLAYVSSLWLRRHRAAATAVAVALVAGLLGTVSFVVNLEQARLEASAARDETAQRLVEATALARLAQSRAAGAAGSSTEALRRAWEAVELHETPATVQGLREALALPGFITELHPCEKGVWHAEFSPDGRTVLTVGSDFTARLWNLQGEELLRLGAEDQQVTAATFSPDGSEVLVGTLRGQVRIYDRSGALKLQREVLRGGVIATSYLRGEKTIAVSGALTASGRQGTAIIDRSGWCLARLPAPEGAGLVSVKSSSSGNRVLQLFDDGDARVIDSQARVVSHLDWPGQEIAAADFGPGGQRIFATSKRGAARVWQADGAVLLDLSPDDFSPGYQWDSNYITSAGSSFEGRRILAVQRSGALGIWGDGDGRFVVPPGLPGLESFVTSAVESPDGDLLTTRGDGSVRLIDFAGRELTTLSTREIGPSVIVAMGDGSDRLLTMGMDRRLFLWALDDSSRFVVGEGHVWDVAASPGGDRLAFADMNQVCELDPATRSVGACVNVAGAGRVGLRFTQDGQELLIITDTMGVQAWRPGEAPRQLLRRADVFDAWLVGDGSHLLVRAGLWGQAVCNLATGQCLSGYLLDACVDVLPCGEETDILSCTTFGLERWAARVYFEEPLADRLWEGRCSQLDVVGCQVALIGNDDAVCVIDVVEGAESCWHAGPGFEPADVTLSDDQEHVLVESTEGAMRLYTSAGQLVGETERQPAILEAQFLPAKRGFFAIDAAGRLRVWSLRLERLLQVETKNARVPSRVLDGRELWSLAPDSGLSRVVIDTGSLKDSASRRLALLDSARGAHEDGDR